MIFRDELSWLSIDFIIFAIRLRTHAIITLPIRQITPFTLHLRHALFEMAFHAAIERAYSFLMLYAALLPDAASYALYFHDAADYDAASIY